MDFERIVRLKEGESILRIVRSFWLVRLPQAILAGLLITAPFFFMIPLFSLRTFGLIAFLLSIFTGLIYALRLYIEWSCNAFVVTTRRVIDVDQHGFFRRTVSEALYEKLQDVSFTVAGIWGTVFRYGTIVVQTAGSQISLELPYVRRPQELHYLITETAASRQPEDVDGLRSQRVTHLLDAAADLNDAEARAFLVALQEAVNHGGREHQLSSRSLDQIMTDDDED